MTPEGGFPEAGCPEGGVSEDGGSEWDVLRLRELIRPGDRVVWGQASGEPRALTRQLVEQRAELPGVTCFAGIPAGAPADATLRPDAVRPLRVESYCGTGANRALHRAGLLDIVPVPYSTLPELLAGGALAADVVLVQVSEPDDHGRHSLGLADDYFSAALDTARVVIAEINRHVPATPGARTLTPADWTACVHSDDVPAQLPTPDFSPVLRAVAAQVAFVVPDQATVQFGIGALPEACLDALHAHTGIGIHSGILNDAALRLMRAGVATGAHKTVDTGVAVAGVVGGSSELFAFLDRNPRVNLRGTRYTHDIDVLGAQHRMVAINSAIEVDLTGQVNAEVAGGRYVGAVGGATDFLRGAARSPGGVPIIALPSTAGGNSRIVTRLSGPVSIARSDVGVVVTEYGSADLRGRSESSRAERLLAIAHPDHRDTLAAELEEHLMKPVLV